MELELMGEKIRYYDVAMDSTTRCEETMEAIVPDALPDIGSIVDAEGTVLVRNKEVTDGRAQISGVVAATIIYAPDPQDCVKKLEMSIPFTCNLEGRGLTPDSCLVIRCAQPLVDARMLNPRKVLAKVNVIISTTAYTPSEKDFCSGAAESEYPAELKKESLNAYLAVDTGEKTFSVIDELEMAASKPAIGEVLKSRVSTNTEDAKIIGNKAIFKCSAFITLVYLSYENQEVCTAEFEMPFSQIVELNHSFDEPDCSVSLFLTGCEILARTEHSSGARNISVSLFMAAQAVAWKNMSLEVISDIYSTTHELRPEWGMLDFTTLSDKGSKHQSFREIIEISDNIRSITDVRVCLGEVNIGRDGDSTVLTSEAQVTLSYISGEGAYCCARKTVEVSAKMECPEGAAVRAEAVCGRENYAVAVSGGAEIRFNVDFDVFCLMPKKLSIVNAAKFGDPKDISDKPSVTIKAFTESESLWSMAKKYDATVENILIANGLDSETEPEEGRLLLIPRKRGK